jgi:hypothetical protein
MKKEIGDTDKHNLKIMRRDTEGSCHLQAQERGLAQILLSSTLRGNQPCHWVWTLPPELWDDTFLLFKQPTFAILCYNSPKNTLSTPQSFTPRLCLPQQTNRFVLQSSLKHLGWGMVTSECGMSLCWFLVQCHPFLDLNNSLRVWTRVIFVSGLRFQVNIRTWNHRSTSTSYLGWRR